MDKKFGTNYTVWQKDIFGGSGHVEAHRTKKDKKGYVAI